MLTYERANVMLGKRDSKKLDNNTFLYRCDNGTTQHDIVVILHQSEIIRIHPDGTYTVSSGGYRSMTTKSRINEYSPACVFQKNHHWFLHMGLYQDPNAKSIPFQDGMRVDANGYLVNS